MADDIGFKIIAGIEGLKAAMAESTAAVRNFSTQAKEHVEIVGGAFETLNKAMAGFAAVLAGGLIFKEVIEGTEHWNDSVKALSRQFGTTTEKASGLAVALRNIGSSSEEYGAVASKLDRQVKGNEDRVNELGVATRGANGELLTQQQIMLNAIKVIGDYKEGTDRNIAAQFLLGRNVGDLGKLLRLTNEQIERGAEDAERFGLVVDGDAVTAGRNFKMAMSELNLAILGMERALGEKIIPTLTNLAVVFTDKIIPAIGAAIDKVNEFVQVWGKIYALYASAGDPALRDAVLDEMNNVPYGKQKAAGDNAAAAGGGSKVIPKGFGTDAGEKAAKKELELKKATLAAEQQALGDNIAAKIQLENTYLAWVEDNYDRDSVEYQSALKEKYRLDQEYKAQSVKLYSQMFDAIDNAFTQSINGVLQGTQTWGNAIRNIFSNIGLSFVNLGEKMLFAWIKTQLGLTSATTAGNAARTASDTAADSTSLTSHIGTALKKIAGDAAETYAGVFAFFAPELGPFAAIPAGAAAALVAGASAIFGGFRAGGGPVSVGQGYVVGENGPEWFQPGSAGNILNAGQLAAAAGGGGGNVSIHLSAIDTRSGAQFLKDNAAAIARAVNNQIRNANPNLTGIRT